MFSAFPPDIVWRQITDVAGLGRLKLGVPRGEKGEGCVYFKAKRREWLQACYRAIARTTYLAAVLTPPPATSRCESFFEDFPQVEAQSREDGKGDSRGTGTRVVSNKP